MKNNQDHPSPTGSDDEFNSEDQSSGAEDDQLPMAESKKKKRRGRKRIPNQWSRIIAVDEINVDDLEVWPIAQDIEAENTELQPVKGRKKKDWEPLFISEGFFTTQDKPELGDYILKDRKLRMLG